MFLPLFQRLQPCGPRRVAVSITSQCARVSCGRLFDQLPALGSVLYIPMRTTALEPLGVPNRCLVDNALLAPLLRTHTIRIACAITTEGPREWIDCLDGQDLPCARMHLLPDTDYLAWDALAGCGHPIAELKTTTSALEGSPVSARMLRFRTYPLAGLRVLAADDAGTLSRLSRDLAGRIARDEVLPLPSAASE